MDKILIRGLQISACHGCNQSEKVNPQPFIFDADVFYDFSAAYASDDLSHTLNYSSICKTIVAAATAYSYNLIEKLAYVCAYAVMNAFPASKISLTVYKPQAPIKQNFNTVGVTVEVERQTAYLSLGASLGDRQKNILSALEKLNTYPQIEVKEVSSIIETEPYGGVAVNRFLNCAAKIETLFTPRGLLNAIHAVEEELGRERTVHWGDRTIDIDIIFFGDKVIFQSGLIIPHPEYSKRDFVLRPLREIAPDFVCPLLKKKIKDI